MATYTDELGRECEEAIHVDVLTGDPDELAHAAEEAWARTHPAEAGLLPEDLEWEEVEEEE